MRRIPNRHYRVVERDKQVECDADKLSQKNISQITLVSLLIYMVSVFLSISLGYIIGRQK